MIFLQTSVKVLRSKVNVLIFLGLSQKSKKSACVTCVTCVTLRALRSAEPILK